MMETNPQGWKARQARARMRQRHGMSREQRAEVREIRRRHALSLETQAAQESYVTVAEADAYFQASSPGPKAPEHMDWKEMAGELRAAGKFVPPRIGETKLRQRVVELRAEQGVE